jgi:hypothetical protein
VKPGIYPALPMREYLALPAIGSGVIKTIVERCPAAAWHESYLNPHRAPDPSKASDAGELAHAIVLEGSEERVCVIDPRNYPAKTTGSIPDGWTNAAIRAARDEVRAEGKIPVLRDDWSRIKAMADSARAFIDGLRESEPAVWRAFQPDGGASELTAVWLEGETLCRMRHDRISADRMLDINLKFVSRSAHPEAFARSGLLSMGYAIASAWYRRGMRAAYRVDDAKTVFVVVEQEPPHLCSLVGLDPEFTSWADARAARALRDWQACVANDQWPAYPHRVCYAELPRWEAAKLEEDEIESPFGIPYDVDKLFKRKEAA